jgi:hypothetical protein
VGLSPTSPHPTARSNCARAALGRSVDLGFLGRWLFDRETPRFGGLEKLGFPWILSFESRLINGLRGIFREKNFARPFARGGRAGTADARSSHADAHNYS